MVDQLCVIPPEDACCSHVLIPDAYPTEIIIDPNTEVVTVLWYTDPKEPICLTLIPKKLSSIPKIKTVKTDPDERLDGCPP